MAGDHADRPRRPRDVNELAAAIVAESVGDAPPQPAKDPAAIARGRKGGQTRAQRMTPEQRSEDARAAVQARWAKARETAQN